MLVFTSEFLRYESNGYTLIFIIWNLHDADRQEKYLMIRISAYIHKYSDYFIDILVLQFTNHKSIKIILASLKKFLNKY